MKRSMRAWLPLAAAALAVPGTARAACTVAAGTDGNGNAKLTIKGTATAQTIQLLDAGTSVQVQVDCNNDGDVGDPGEDQTIATSFEVFEVAGGGRDVVTYQNQTALVGARKSLAVIFGPAPPAQPNQLIVALSGLSANGSFTLDLQGGAGRDNVTVQAATVTNSSVVVRGDLGGGDDQLSLVTFGSVTNSSITNDVALGLGRNLLIDVPNAAFSNSTYTTRVSGSDTPTGKDDAAFVTDSLVLDVGSRLIHDIRLLGGSDTFRGSIDGPTISNGSELIVRARGGVGADTLALNDLPFGRPVSVDGTSHLSAFLTGGIGNDLVTADLTFDNSGFHRVFLSGGDGNDVVFGGLGADSSSNTPNADIALEGGRGSDAVYLAATDPSGSATFDPMGAALLAGGTFDDLIDDCVFFGDAPFQKLDCETGS